MTNREMCINNEKQLSNKDLMTYIDDRGNKICRLINCKNLSISCAECDYCNKKQKLEQWLSQEAEEARTCKDCLYGKTFEDGVKRYCCYNYLNVVADNEGCSKWKSKNTKKIF